MDGQMKKRMATTKELWSYSKGFLSYNKGALDSLQTAMLNEVGKAYLYAPEHKATWNRAYTYAPEH
eukprot:1151773-Pelagomonas_calceolata.AAC.4